MLVGYQGIEGSFSNQAAIEFIEKMDIKDAKLVPLINSDVVINELINGNIDYGVVAIKNSTAGVVFETKEALANKSVKCLGKIDLKIIHCLFMMKNTKKENLSKVVSHEQALSQTLINRKNFFSNLEPIKYKDTALAAKDLSNSILDNTNAVICSKIAGEMYNLELIYEGLNDSEFNYTTFGIYIR